MTKRVFLLFSITFIFYSIINGQDSATVFYAELEEIIIKPKGKIKKLTTYDLISNKSVFKQNAQFPIPNIIANNVGIYIPVKTYKELYISQVAFPLNHNGTKPTLTYTITVLFQNGKDTIIIIEPEKVGITSNSMILDIMQTFTFEQPIMGFYFFIENEEVLSNQKITMNFSNRYKSKLTYYKDNNNKIQPFDLRPFINANTDKQYSINFLNLKISIKYLVL